MTAATSPDHGPYRYARVMEDLPAHGLKAGDLVEVPLDPLEPVRSYRVHGYDRGWVVAALADRSFDPVKTPRPRHLQLVRDS